MDAILPVDVLSQCFSEPEREFHQRYQEAVDWPDIGPVRDTWSRAFREGTCESLHPSISRFEIGWTPDFDCHDLVAWVICLCCCVNPNNSRELVVSSTHSWKPPRSEKLRTGRLSCSNISCSRTEVSQEKIRW